ncbi:MAG: polysaccharide biosynthesis/export protein [Alphaproteobacteria bacterium]|nr:polysaccharide biosynthesis/export protein [Alphaproteobacteria bacterium]
MMQWPIRLPVVLSSALLLVLSILGTAGEAAAQVAKSGMIGDLIEQLESEGRLGTVLDPRASPVDAARELQREVGQETPSVEVSPLATSTEQLLVQRFCEGLTNEDEERLLALAKDFSGIERDYCRRVGEEVRQYGYNQFLGSPRVDPLMSGAIQDDYVVGIGDELVIGFQGQTTRSITTRVDREGRLYLDDLGTVSAAGRRFGDVREEIEVRTEAAMIGTEVYVSVGAVREIAVIVAGEVKAPGTYVLTGLSTVFDALLGAQGIKKTGSIRRIHLTRGDRTLWIDGYDVLLSGRAQAGFVLAEGDVVFVPPLGSTVAIAGQVKRPGVYELAEGEHEIALSALLDMAGGGLRPRGTRYTILSFDELGREQFTEADGQSVILREGDIVIAQPGGNVQLSRVELSGHVRVPGGRSLAAAPTVRALLGGASNLAENPYLLFAVLQTTDPATRARRLFAIGLQRVLAGKQDFRLKDGDRLIILSNEDIRFLSSADVQEIILTGHPSGEVPTAALEPSRSTEAASSAQLMRDGATPDPDAPTPAAGEEKPPCRALDTLSLLMTDARQGRFATAIRIATSELRGLHLIALPCPPIYDRFPDLLPFVLEHVAAVSGEVRVPGTYPLTADTRLSHVIAVVGGPTREADLAHVELLHYSGPGALEDPDVRDVVDLGRVDGAAVAVGPGDVIRFNQLFSDREAGPVQLAGEVVRPGFYQIRRGERLSELIARAGGLTPQAYPHGAVFTRERVREAEQEGLIRATRDLNASLAVAAAQRDIDANAVRSLLDLVRGMSEAAAVGRVVIEADPTVLDVRPELDTVLEPGDLLFMPKRPNSVLVIGDVLNPGAMQFIAGKKVDQYIRQAGGFQRSADEDRVFVVYPNGEAQPVSVNVWNYTPVRVPPGSTIVVPKDPAPLDLFQITRDFAQVVSQLAITAASLAVIGDR